MVESLLREVEAFSMRFSLEAGPPKRLFQLYSIEFSFIYITPNLKTNAKEEFSSHWFFNGKRLQYVWIKGAVLS